MNHIKEWFGRQQYRLTEVFRKFMGTLVLSFLLCVFWEYTVISSKQHGTTIEYIFIFLFMAIIGTFFTECVLRGRKSREASITGYIFAGLGAFLWVILDVITKSGVSDFTMYYMIVFAVMYVLVLLGLAFLALIKDSGLAFEQYMLRIIISILRILLIMVILNLGVLLILWLFSTLIAKFNYTSWLIYVEIILLALVYLPYGLSCLIDSSEPEQTRFAKGMVQYALMPMLIAAMGIIYIYMFKLVVTWDFPSNQVFPICAVLFCAGFLIWTMAYAYTRRNVSVFYNKIIRYMKYIYAPFVLLESYAIGIRIHEYGWTILRYGCVAFIVLQVVYIAWEPLANLVLLIRREKRIHYAEHYEWMIYVIFGLAFFALIFPWSSASYVEYLSQKNRFEVVCDNVRRMHEVDRQWTPEEYQEVAKLQYSGRSIRHVLSNNIYGSSYLTMNYVSTDLDRMFNIDSSWWKQQEPQKEEPVQPTTIDSSDYFNGGIDIDDGLTVENYKKMFTTSLYLAFDNPVEWVDLTRMKLIYGKNQEVPVDLTGCISTMIADAEHYGNTEVDDPPEEDTESLTEEIRLDPEEIFRIRAGEGMLLITQITFRYDRSLKMVYNLSMSGYLLFP